MKKYKFCFFFMLIILVMGLLGLLVVFLENSEIAILTPKGIIAEKQKQLLIDATWLMLIVVVPALFLTFFYAWKYRESNEKATHAPDWDQNVVIEAIWWGVPFMIVIVLSIFTWRACYDLDPFLPIQSEAKPVKIQVVALQWRWLFIYPEEKIATINWVQFPEKHPLDFEITADAPMNSFWIPQLGGQIYAMAGMRSELHLMADEPGTFRGSSANLSGSGFSNMWFTAVSSSEQDFKNWASLIRSKAQPLTMENYRKLAEPNDEIKPVYYSLEDERLFEKILMQYMPHTSKEMP